MDPTTPTPDVLSWEFLVSPAGVVIAAGIVTSVIQILKTAIPALVRVASGALQALIFTVVIYVLTAIVMAPESPDGYLQIFAAWVSCATSAVGAYELLVKPAVQAIEANRPNRILVGPNEPFDEE